MKEVLIGFLLYILYDMFQRDKTERLYAKRQDFDAFKLLVRGDSRTDVDVSGIVYQLNKLEGVVTSRVSTFEKMLSMIKLGKASNFTVINDEQELDQNVPYTWDGQMLFLRGIVQSDIQPSF